MKYELCMINKNKTEVQEAISPFCQKSKTNKVILTKTFDLMLYQLMINFALMN